MSTYKAAVIGCGGRGARVDGPDSSRTTLSKPPLSHASGYAACNRTVLVCGADVRETALEEFGRNWSIASNHLYTDYREMIVRERPDIISVVTQPEQRAEVVVFAAENGVKAVFAEKAMAASKAEADAMVEAVERNGVAFNMGTNRRWDPGYRTLRDLANSGELGELRCIVIYQTRSLFNAGSHWLDLIQFLNRDCPAVWVQAHLTDGGDDIENGLLRQDPWGHGIVQFANGVSGYALLTERADEQQVRCERGVASVLGNGAEWRLRKAIASAQPGRPALTEVPFPAFERESSTLHIIEDLVHALDAGVPPQGGVRVARANTELIFAFIESHLRGGKRVELPLVGPTVRLAREFDPHGTKFKPNPRGARPLEPRAS